jgi:hypothetical protein
VASTNASPAAPPPRESPDSAVVTPPALGVGI